MIPIMRTPTSITAASFVKIDSRTAAHPTTKQDMPAAITAAIPRQMRTLLRMRSFLPAPKFCPAKVVIATPSAFMTIQKIPSILAYAAHAATVSVPNELIADWINILDSA